MILVTGGLGYLGGRLCSFLTENKQKLILGVRDLADVNRVPPKLRDLERRHIDLEDSQSLKDSCRGVSTVVHLAGLNSKECSIDTEKAVLVNGIGTYHLLRSALKHRTSKFIYLSTIHTYGPTDSGHFDELTMPMPTHPYSISHTLAENFVRQASTGENMTGIILRLSNAVGYPVAKTTDCWDLFTNEISKQIAIDNQLTIRSNPTTLRDFISITDFCTAVMKVISERLPSGTHYFNLTSGTCMTIKEMALLVSAIATELFNKSPSIHFLSKDSFEKPSSRIVFPNNRIKNTFGIEFSREEIERELKQLILKCSNWLPDRHAK